MKRALIVGALGLLVLAGCFDADPEFADEPSPSTTAPATTTTTTTTTIAPEDIEPIDEEEFGVDREFSADSQAESFGPIGSTQTTIATEGGEVSIGGGDVPALAADFPLPEGYEIQLTTERPGEVGFSGRIDGDLADLAAFFETELPRAGYEIVDRQEVPGVLGVLSIEGPYVGDVVISEEPGGPGWTLVVALALAG